MWMKIEDVDYESIPKRKNLLVTNGEVISIGYLLAGSWKFFIEPYVSDSEINNCNITHWQLLPELPEEKLK